MATPRKPPSVLTTPWRPADTRRVLNPLKIDAALARGREVRASIEAVVARLAASFRDEWPDQVAQLRTALDAADWPAVRQQTHRIKGLAGSIGFDHLTALAAPVEQHIDRGHLAAAHACCQRLLAASPDTVEADHG